jgi:hypothetical protein
MADAFADGPPALKDPAAEHPIAGAWRPMLCEVVRCFVQGDYGLARGVVGVEPISAATAEQVRSNLAAYGATLVELPDDAWQTSVAQWMGRHGTFWSTCGRPRKAAVIWRSTAGSLRAVQELASWSTWCMSLERARGAARRTASGCGSHYGVTG